MRDYAPIYAARNKRAARNRVIAAHVAMFVRGAVFGGSATFFAYVLLEFLTP